ncbi:MAG: hypothetical protein F2736_06310, partial [Actinobacteria bacterium]|nr:hypothetical protein [Actinomycetota bacterium]
MSPWSKRIHVLARLVLGAFLIIAGIGHLGAQRIEFQAQVPSWIPIAANTVVIISGVVELSLGAALVLARRRAPIVGVIVAAFFVVIFPGNIAQFVEGKNAFGLDSDKQRFIRLWFQPVLVICALW